MIYIKQIKSEDNQIGDLLWITFGPWSLQYDWHQLLLNQIPNPSKDEGRAIVHFDV